jgi:hypothetical protein
MIIKKPELINKLRLKYKELSISIEEINIFGIRFEENQNQDIWNDILGIWTQHNVYCWSGTTDPGRHATETKEGGSAHLCLGYHKDIWQTGTHCKDNPNFAHAALVQTGNECRIWRDVNKDYEDNDNKIEIGYFGINFHRASKLQNVSNIGLYGAGCQVTQDIKDFEFALNLILNTEKFKSNQKCCFSYMLFDRREIGL